MRAIFFLLALCNIGLESKAESFPPNQKKEEKIGVVDVLYILDNSPAFNELKQQFSKIIQDHQVYFSDHEQKLREKDEKLQEEQRKLEQQDLMEVEDNKEERVRQLSSKQKRAQQLLEQRQLYDIEVKNFQEDIEKKKEKIDESYSEAYRKLHLTLLEVIAEYAKQHGYTLVIQQANVLFLEDVNNITEPISERLNQKLGDLKVYLTPLKVDPTLLEELTEAQRKKAKKSKGEEHD